MGLKPRELVVIAPMNCPIRERTADGVSMGRCWHYLMTVTVDCQRPILICPIHGDVTDQREAFLQTGSLQEDPR